MLFVLFQVGSERCAVDAQRVVEIVPLVHLKRMPQAARGVAGMFLYRGRPVPALDLCQLNLGRPSIDHFSTRIIIVNHSNPDGEDQLLGLIAERVTEILRRDDQGLESAASATKGDSLTGPVLTDGEAVIQLLIPERLVQSSMQSQLFAEPTEAKHATD